MQNTLINKITFLNQTTVESLGESDEKNIITRFAESSVEIMGGDFGFVWLNKKGSDSKKFQLVYASSNTPYTPKPPRSHGSTEIVLKTKKPLLIEDLDHSKYVRKDAKPYLKSLVVIPMVYKNNVYGSFYICFKKKCKFDDEDRSLAEFIGIDAGQVITIHLFHRKAEKDSIKLLKQKDEFFNIVSHELKTPITTIKGFSQVLVDRLVKGDATTKYYLEKINNQADKLSRLINDLLDVSRIETGKLQFEKDNFEMRRMIRQVLEGLRVAIVSHPIYFSSDYQFWVRGDSERIEGVLINLITNAAKYSPVGSKIKVRLKDMGGKACVEVEDFGYGIPERDKFKVFNRFFRSKNSNKQNSPGLGLGLYIANSIVKHHGGSLGLVSKKKTKGTIFYFTLPFYRCRIDK